MFAKVLARRLLLRGAAAAVLCVSAVAGARPARAQGTAPATPDGASAKASGPTTTDFMVDGVHVVLRQTTANDVVAANLYLLGGTRQLTPETQGIEAMLLIASERGTKRFSKDALRALTARLGSDIVIDPAVDWSMIGARSLRDSFDSTWMVLADRVTAPRLDSAEVERVREQILSDVSTRRDSPDALVAALADSATWQGHPYALQPLGTMESITRITLADLKKYEREQMVTSRMLLVVVGNVDRAKIEQLVHATIGKQPRGSYRWTPPPTLPTGMPSLTIAPRSLPTNYLLGYYAGPPASSSDYPALRVATAVLSGRLFSEIRSRRNLTYAVDAPFVERAASAGGLYVTTTVPDTTLALMRAEVKRLQEDEIDPSGLERLVQQFITEYFLNNETNAAQADFIARAVLYRGSALAADRFVDELRAVRPEDVKRIARTYMRGVRFAYVGDPAQAPRRAEAGF
ncbi:MAG TPA: pitrilysin family protein [Gemmatimonadaceae bacterium]|nr:pitrilysin family protein [Gemmatimonadaceae bacterium]